MNLPGSPAGHAPVIALIGFDEALTQNMAPCDFKGRTLRHFANGMKLAAAWETGQVDVAAVICAGEIMSPSGLALVGTLEKKGLGGIPYFLVAGHLNNNLRRLALTAGIADVFTTPLNPDRVSKRVNFLIAHWSAIIANSKTTAPRLKSIGLAKRAFDLFFAGMALLLLSPLFAIVYLLIRLESKGPAFYYSLRVGTGYKVFKFYKFRSMFVNADQRLKDLKHLNQYNAAGAPQEIPAPAAMLCAQCAATGKCQYALYADTMQWCEKDFIGSKQAKAGSAFIKIKNDPRITRVGNFIRNSSIDELPQLWNVIIGNMSIVGNRPLPLYEAEKLTTDKYILRFAAPAGITGLWQVEKRGKGEMSEEERLMLDNVYARDHSLKNDLKLIMKTIPALLQKESV
jgi:lipopolysaccharide/colanic/teichoic acid biosynthesis glycosyltransferase